MRKYGISTGNYFTNDINYFSDIYLNQISSFDLASILKVVKFMSKSSNSIDLLIIYVSEISKKKMTTTKNETVKKIFATMDRFTTVDEKKIGGDIVKQIFHAILCLISKLFTPSLR